jgi:hypothetical protein
MSKSIGESAARMAGLGMCVMPGFRNRRDFSLPGAEVAFGLALIASTPAYVRRLGVMVFTRLKPESSQRSFRRTGRARIA